ncbi:hypothetical protein Pelo_8022 [Pelomyxa schiedti]|nr:hypothetical protein Pelo_8022 [Pelomyxa schiedti]
MLSIDNELRRSLRTGSTTPPVPTAPTSISAETPATSPAPLAPLTASTTAQGPEEERTLDRKRCTPSAAISPAQALNDTLQRTFSLRSQAFVAFRGFMEDEMLPQNFTKSEWDSVVEMGTQLQQKMRSGHSIVSDAHAMQFDVRLREKLEATMKTFTKVWKKKDALKSEPVVVQVLVAIAYFLKCKKQCGSSPSSGDIPISTRFTPTEQQPKMPSTQYPTATSFPGSNSSSAAPEKDPNNYVLCLVPLPTPEIPQLHLLQHNSLDTIVEIQCSGVDMEPLRGWNFRPANPYTVSYKTQEHRNVAIKMLCKKISDPLKLWTIAGKEDIASETVDSLEGEIRNIWKTRYYCNAHTTAPCCCHISFDRFLQNQVDAETLFSELHEFRDDWNSVNGILHVSNVRDPEGTTPRNIQDALLNLIEIGKKIALIISGSLLVLSKYNLEPGIFENVLTPIVSREVAFQLLYNIFDTTPGSSFFGLEQDRILDQMRLVAAALEYTPTLFLEFLSVMQRFSSKYPDRSPDLLDIILESWKQVLNDITEETKSIGRIKISELKEHLLRILPEIDWCGLRSRGTFEVPSSKKLIEIGEILDTIGWSCFIPLPGDRFKVYVPFAVLAPLYDPEWQLDLDTESWRHKMVLMKPTKGFSFEECVQRVQMDPGSPGFCAMWESPRYHADPNSHKRIKTFTHLHEVSTDWMIVYKVLGCKNDVKTETTTEKVDSVSLGLKNKICIANPDAPDYIQNQSQITCKSKALESKCEKGWVEALKRKENAVYTFLSANQLVPTPALLDYMRRDHVVLIDGIKFWKEFRIMSGPYLFCLFPEAFLYAIDPALGARVFDPNIHHEQNHPPIPKKSRACSPANSS